MIKAGCPDYVCKGCGKPSYGKRCRACFTKNKGGALSKSKSEKNRADKRKKIRGDEAV